MTTTTTRLAALPKEIREAYKPDPMLSSFFGRPDPTPERDRSDHSFHRSTTTEQRAAVNTRKIEYYRGRAQRGGYQGGTTVYVLAVYDGHVVGYIDGQVYTDYDSEKKRTVWHPTLEVAVDGDRHAQRLRASIAREHELADKMRDANYAMVVKAKKSLTKKAHEAKASTKLAHLRKDIARAEKALKKLRAEEKKLARQEAKEEATA